MNDKHNAYICAEIGIVDMFFSEIDAGLGLNCAKVYSNILIFLQIDRPQR